MKTKTAMILAAGYGKRLRPITDKIPKPLVQVHDKALIGYTIETLLKIGIKKIIINTHYKANLIRNYINSNYKSSKITITYEKQLLDTGGGAKNACKFFKEKLILIINCDTFWNSNTHKDLINLLTIKKHENNCLLLLCKKNKSYGVENVFGDFILKKNNLLRNELINNNGLIYSGAQIINKSVFNLFAEKKFSFNKIWDYLIKEKKIEGIVMKSDLLHLGNIKSFLLLDKFQP